jgi:hypothetical protein
VKAKRTIGHSRSQRLAGAGGFIDHSNRRKDAGKECVQRAAIIGVVRAGVRMGTTAVTMAIRRMLMGLMCADMLGAGMMMTGQSNGGFGSRMRLRQRRRNDAGELGGQKQRDQKPNRKRLSTEPLHRGIVRPQTTSVNPGRLAG